MIHEMNIVAMTHTSFENPFSELNSKLLEKSFPGPLNILFWLNTITIRLCCRTLSKLTATFALNCSLFQPGFGFLKSNFGSQVSVSVTHSLSGSTL